MASYNILIVDDNDVMLKITKHFLDQQGLDTFITNTGKGAEILVKQFKFELILLDIPMPIQDGYLTAENIKFNQDISIIALTASEHLVEPSKLHFFDSVTSKSDPENLLKIINEFRSSH